MMGLDDLGADLRYAIRTLASARKFSVVAISCLTLGIAANATMFSVFDAMFLRPLPFADADRLVSIAARHPETGRRAALFLDDSRDLSADLKSVAAIAAYAGRAVTLNDGGEPERIATQLVTVNLFSMLGTMPQRGRGFEASDDRGSAGNVALIADSLWRRRYSADPLILGRTIKLDDTVYTIVGVMPPRFRFPSTSELWVPMAPALGTSGVASRGVSIVGRLTADATVELANAELAARPLPATGARGPRAGFARAFGSPAVGSEERTITGALMGATTVLLLIACVNLANLMLARGAGRRRELAVRASLGASRGRIVRQLLTESVVLAVIAGVMALPLAWYGIEWIHEAVPPSDPLGPYYIDWSLDVRTLLYATSVALVTGIAFGLLPALDATGRRLLNPLREGAGAAGSRTEHRAHATLIVAQIALALVLLAGASLFVRTYVGLARVELGYDTSRLMTARVYFAGASYEPAQARARAIDQIARQLSDLPGAYAATVTDLVPLDDQGGSDATADIEGRTFEDGRAPELHYAGVAGNWPETFNVRMLAGRPFSDHELETAGTVALVNSRLAETFWPGENPLGRRFRFGDDSPPWFTVIGIVPDIRTVKLDESRATPPTAYVPHRFVSARNYGIVIRTRAHPESVTRSLRSAVHAVDPSLALFDVYPMEQVRWLSYWMYVMWGTMFAAFAVMALFIAAVGVYGVVFYTVSRRTREIGLRVALGARRAQVVRPMLQHVAVLSLAGLAIGVGGAMWITPLVESLLIGVTPNDPAGLGAVSLLLGIVALAATWFPAWHASAVDPVVALRDE